MPVSGSVTNCWLSESNRMSWPPDGVVTVARASLNDEPQFDVSLIVSVTTSPGWPLNVNRSTSAGASIASESRSPVGTYTIRVNANNLLSVGTYNLGLEAILPVPSPDAVPIACGETASDAIDAPADVDLFTFAGLGGDNVTFGLTETSNWGSSFNDARATIFSPAGVQLGLFDSNGQLPVVLPVDGAYLLRVNANNLLSAGSYDLDVQCP